MTSTAQASLALDLYRAQCLLIMTDALLPTFFCGEGPRSRCYKRTAALRLIVQPCDEDD